MKKYFTRRLAIAGGLLLGAGLAWYGWKLYTRNPWVITIVQTRSAAENPRWQELFAAYQEAKGGPELRVLYETNDEVKANANKGYTPVYDLLLTDRATVQELTRKDELINWEAENPDGKVQVAQDFIEEGYQILYYNKKLVKTVPKTWDELVGLSIDQLDQGRFGLAISDEAYSVLPFVLASLVESDGTFRATADRAALEDGVEAVRMLRQTFALTPQNCSASCAAGIFLDGQAPYAIAGEWRRQEFSTRLGQDLGMAPLPMLGKSQSLSARGQVALVGARATDERNLPVMQAIRAYYASPEGAAQIFTKLGKLPSVYASGQIPAPDAQVKELLDVIQNSSIAVEEQKYMRLLDRLRPEVTAWYSGQAVARDFTNHVGAILSALQDRKE